MLLGRLLRCVSAALVPGQSVSNPVIRLCVVLWLLCPNVSVTCVSVH